MASTYTVVAGDSLWKIGAKTGLPWQNIAKLNNLKSPYTLRIGQVLKLQAAAPVTPAPTPTPTPTPTPLPAQGFSTTAPFKDRLWGTYAETPGRGGTLWELGSLRDLEAKVGKKFSVVSGFVGYDEVPVSNMKTVAAEGRTTVLSYDVEVPFKDILSGKYDATFKSVATQLKGVGGPVYLRLWAEMNGEWASWSVSNRTNVASHAEWIAAWQYLVKLFRSLAPNVKFIFCPNVSDEPRTDRFESYWPGKDFVDVLGFDSYNWGGGSWQTHRQIFTSIYNRVTALDSQMPVWVGEFASAEGTSGQKAAWITDLLAETGFPRLQALLWFSVRKTEDNDKLMDWRMDSSASSLAAFKTGFAK